MNDFLAWFDDKAWLVAMIETTLLIVFVVALIVFLSRLVKRVFTVRDHNQKKMSVYPIIVKCLNGFMYFIGFCFILEIIGISTTPLWTVASAFSVALGFGAQAVIKDIISGFLILTEDHFNVGDIIEVAGKQGKVEEVGLRITRLRDVVDGSLYIIPNGDMGVVTNQTKDFMYAAITLPIPYDQDLNAILKSLRGIAESFELVDKMLEKPDVLGVTAFEDSHMLVRIICKTKAHENWAVERAMRAYFKTELEKQNIVIPFPTHTVHLSS